MISNTIKRTVQFREKNVILATFSSLFFSYYLSIQKEGFKDVPGYIQDYFTLVLVQICCPLISVILFQTSSAASNGKVL